MNKFWGRNENESKNRRFARDNEQILSLNYENLCDSDYLNRIFADDSGNNSTGASYVGNSSGSVAGDKSSSGDTLEPWEITSEIAEDVILFGDDEALGRKFLRRRWKSDISSLSKYQDSLASLIYKQVDVFEHVAKIIMSKAINPIVNDSSLVVSNVVDPSGAASGTMPSFVSDSLQCTLQIVEKQSRKGWKASSLEPLLQLLINSFVSKPEAASIAKLRGSDSTPKTVLSYHSVELLRGAFSNGFLQLTQADEIGTPQQRENALRVSMSAAYGILILGVHTNSVEDVFLAITQLLLLSMQMEEWKISTDSQEAASAISCGTTDSLTTHDVSKKQRIAKMRSGETNSGGIAKISTGLKQSTNSGSHVMKPQAPSIIAIGDDVTQRELSYEEPIFQNSVTSNGAGGISWEKKTTTISINSKLSSIEKERDSNKNKFTMVKPKTPVTTTPNGKMGNYIAASNSITTSFSVATEDFSVIGGISKVVKPLPVAIINPVQQGLKELYGVNGQHSLSKGRQGNFLPLNGPSNQQSLSSTMKGLMMVPKCLVVTLFDILGSAGLPNQPPPTNPVQKRLSGVVPRGVSQSAPVSTPVLVSGSKLNCSTSSSMRQKSASTFVWSCGQNSYGELGLSDVNQRRSFNKISYFDGKGVTSIGAGNEHSLFVTKDGKLFVAGYNDNGQCGTGSTQQVRQLTALQSLDGEDIVSVHVNNGCEHTLAITRDGKLYSFGYNYRGQLGHGTLCSESSPRPVKSLMFKKVLFAASSYHHSLVCCSDGTLFSFGRNDCGQLGHGDTMDRKSPQLIAGVPKEVTGMSCGQFHTSIVSVAGEALVCGKNDYGQLGFDSLENVKNFTKIKLPALSPQKGSTSSSASLNESVKQACCGYYHTLLLLQNGVVVGVGRNDYGQLGLGHSQGKITSCQVIHGLDDKSVVSISAGCYHSVAATSNGMLYMFGRNNHGQLGSGDIDEHHLPHPVDDFVGKRILSVVAGFYHTLVLTSECLTDAVVDKDIVVRPQGAVNTVTISELLLNATSSLPLMDLLEKALASPTAAVTGVTPSSCGTRTATPNTSSNGRVSRASSESNNPSGRHSFTNATLSASSVSADVDAGLSVVGGMVKNFSSKGVARVSFLNGSSADVSGEASGGSTNGQISSSPNDGTFAAEAELPGAPFSGGIINLPHLTPVQKVASNGFTSNFTLNNRSKLPVPELWRSLIVHVNEMLDNVSMEDHHTRSAFGDWKSRSPKELRSNFSWIIKILLSCDALLEVACAEVFSNSTAAASCTTDLGDTVGSAVAGTSSITTFLRNLSSFSSSPPSHNMKFLSALAAVQLLKTVVRVVDLVLGKYGSLLGKICCLLHDQEQQQGGVAVETYTEHLRDALRNRSVSELVTDIHLRSSVVFQRSLQSDREAAVNSSPVPLADIFSPDHVNLASRTLSKLRNKLLFLSIHATPALESKDTLNLKFRETYEELVDSSLNILCSRVEFLFPCISQRCHLISMLGLLFAGRSSTSSGSTFSDNEGIGGGTGGGSELITKHFPVQPDRCLKLFTKICFKYRDLSTVIDLFRTCKYSGLRLFRDILCAYNRLSVLNDDSTLDAMSGSVNSNNNSISLSVGDIFRSVSTLEYCCSNFVKCAVPFIFEGSCEQQNNYFGRNSVRDTAVSLTAVSKFVSGSMVSEMCRSSLTEPELQMFGIQIVREVCHSAIFMLDSVGRQHPLDSAAAASVSATVGSVIPSILPTILLYGIHYASSRPLVAEFMPIVQSLSRSVYNFVASVSGLLTPNGQATAVSLSGRSFGLNALNVADVSPLMVAGSKFAAEISTCPHPPVWRGSDPHELLSEVTARFSVDDPFWKKEPLQLSWCSRLLKICTIFASKLASSYICDSNFYVNRLARLSLYTYKTPVLSKFSVSVCLQLDKHALWHFLSGPNLSVEWASVADIDNALSVDELIGKQSTISIPPRIISATTALRMRQFKTDPMYKQLFSATKLPATGGPSGGRGSGGPPPPTVSVGNSLTSCYQCIEAMIMDCVMHVVGYDTLDLWMNYMDSRSVVPSESTQSSLIFGTTNAASVTADIYPLNARGTSQLKLIWDAVSSFSKSLLRNRSKLMAKTATDSWMDVMKMLVSACSCIRSMILLCIPALEPNHGLLGTRSVAPSLLSSPKKAFRRAVLLIICCKRWQAATLVRASSVGLVVVAFFNSVVDCVTDNFNDPLLENVQSRWKLILSNLSYRAEDSSKLYRGLMSFDRLMHETPIPSMKCDILAEFSRAWKLRSEFETESEREQQQRPSAAAMTTAGSASFCDLNTILDTKLALSSLLSRMIFITRDFYYSYRANLSVAGTGEIVLLTISLKFLRQFCAQRFDCSSVSTSFDAFTKEVSRYGWSSFFNELKLLFILLEERAGDAVTQSILQDEQQPQTQTQGKPGTAGHLPASVHAGLSASNNSSIINNKRPHPRDRNKLLRKAAGAIISLIQEITVQATHTTKRLYRSNTCNLLLSLHCDLFSIVQRTRINMSRNGVDVDVGINKPLAVGGGHAETLQSNGSTSPSKSAGSKDAAAKKRCQELIPKSMEFCRSQEGFVVQSDKLLNNYKGSADFTLATWMYIRKTPTKQCFITGKVSHNDAWPILTLRADGKLALYYGHGNEFESLISQAAVQCCQWTHVIVVVEAKKVKIFINGLPDNQAHTRGNTRAVLYPVIVGSCPQGVRTRIDQVKEGFEGILAQYKYYTRALSPIHIRVIYDQGPPESYDVQERWLYQLMGSCKLLLSKLDVDGMNTIPEVTAMVTNLSEVLHMLFVTDTTSRLRISALLLLTALLKQSPVTDFRLSCHNGNLSFGSYATSSSNGSDVPVSVASCSFLDAAPPAALSASFTDHLALYFIRLMGFCSSPHVLSVTDDTLSDNVDFISVLQQQSRNSRLQLQHSSELDNEFFVLRDYFEYIPAFLTCRTAKLDDGTGANVALSPTNNELSREDEISELRSHVLSCLRSLSMADNWRRAISRVVEASLNKTYETLESTTSRGSQIYGLNGADTGSLGIGSSSHTSKSFASRVFGRNGAWSLLVSLESLGVAVLLGERWSTPCVGADVNSYFSTSLGRVLNVNKGSGLITLLSWSNLFADRQLSVVRSVDVTCSCLGSAIQLNGDIVDPVLYRVLVALERFAALILTDHMCICKPDHGFQRQSMLRIFRPFEVYLFHALLNYVSQSGSSQAQLIKVCPSLGTFFTQAVVQAFHVGSFDEDSEEPVPEPTLAALWVKSAKYNIALMGKVCTSEFPPTESERSLLDFVSRGLGVAVEPFLQTPFESYLKQGALSHLLFAVPMSSVLSEYEKNAEAANVPYAVEDGGDDSETAGLSGTELFAKPERSMRSSNNNNNHEDDEDDRNREQEYGGNNSLFEMKLRALIARFPLNHDSGSSSNSSLTAGSAFLHPQTTKFPMNDWLSAAAEGNAINLFGSSQHTDSGGHAIPAVATLKCMHIMRHEIIRCSRRLLLASFFEQKSSFQSLPFMTKYLIWCALCSSVFHYETFRRQEQLQQYQHQQYRRSPKTASQRAEDMRGSYTMNTTDFLNPPVVDIDMEHAVLLNMMEDLYLHHRIEVTHALTLSLVFARNSLLLQVSSPSTSSKYGALGSSSGAGGSILVCSNIVSRIFDACARWMQFHVDKPFEVELCCEILKTLLPALGCDAARSLSGSADSAEGVGASGSADVNTIANEVELCMMQWCRNALYRLIQLATSSATADKAGRSSYVVALGAVAREISDLVKSSNFTVIRARAQEQLFRQRANSAYQFNELAQQLSHLTANLEIIQRIGCVPASPIGFLPYKNALRGLIDPFSSQQQPVSPRSSSSRVGLSRPASGYGGLSKQLTSSTVTSSANTHAGWDADMLTDYEFLTEAPVIVGTREMSVEVDLTACAKSALNYAQYFSYCATLGEGFVEFGLSPVAFEEFRQNKAKVPIQIPDSEDNIMIEVALGVDMEIVGEEPVYEVIYCGSSESLMHSGLSPNCSYRLKCRASVTATSSVASSSFSLDWSREISFKTADGIPFNFDPLKCGPDIILSEDGLTASYAGDDSWSTLLGSRSFSNGISSWKIKISQSSTAYLFVGIATAQADLNTFLGGCNHGHGFIGEQALYHNREKVKVYGDTFGSGDVIGVTLDLDIGTLSFSKNGKSFGVAFDKIYGEIFPAVAFYNVGQELEIVMDSFHTTCPQEPIPCCVSSRSNVDEISVLWEMLYCLHTNTPLSFRILSLVAEHSNSWCHLSQIRCKIASGKNIFLNKCVQLPGLNVSDAESAAAANSTASTFDYCVGERVRTPYGVAEIAGFAYNRVWFSIADAAAGPTVTGTTPPVDAIWYFSYSQIAKGREKGYFWRCSYDNVELSTEGGSSSTNGRLVAAASTSALSGTTPTYDVVSLHELLDPSRWSPELDAVLLSFLTSKGEEHSISPWLVSAAMVNDEFRSLQQALSRIVLNSVDLSHRYGIAGPKRKAVIARLGFLRYFNHLVDHYMPAVLSTLASSNIELYYAQLSNCQHSSATGISCYGGGSGGSGVVSIADDFQVRVVTVRDLSPPPPPLLSHSLLPPLPPAVPPIDAVVSMPPSKFSWSSLGEEPTGGVVPVPLYTDLDMVEGGPAQQPVSSSHGLCVQGRRPKQANLRHPALSLSWISKPHHLPATLANSRTRIFPDIKLSHFWDLLSKSSTRTSKIEDDYDYPDDLPQIKINRLKSFRAYEASQLMGISGEDLIQSSLFFQLMQQLRKESTAEKLRMSYIHPMDDGQSRAFKIKFDGEGVDDYGGPYREIFQQVCDELQRPDPVHAATFSRSTDNVDVERGGRGSTQGTTREESSTKDDANANQGNSVPEITRLSNTLMDGYLATAGADHEIRPVHCFLQILLPTPNWTIPTCQERYKYTFYPGSLSTIRSEFYTFFGQLVGIALRSRITLDIMLASFIWKMVVQETLTESDIASFDYTAYSYISSLGNLFSKYAALEEVASVSTTASSDRVSDAPRAALIAEINVYIENATWSMTRVDGCVVELCDGGAQRALRLEDVGEYLAVYTEAKLLESYPAISAFRSGLLSVIPETAVALLSWTELELLVCGSILNIDVQRLRANTEYDDDISAADEYIVFFWETLEEFSDLEKSAFLRFVWARPTLPPKGIDFPQKFKIQSAAGEDSSLKPDQYLPKAHTCFFSINLPKYSSKKVS
jgi:alpha-tubulin suppressor-like RCC1 family protein